jgi:hypothetical protein
MVGRMRRMQGGRRTVRSAAAALAAALACLLPGPASARQSAADGTIRGRVVDELNGAGLPGAEVTFLDDARRVRSRAVTDPEGHFVLSRLPPGPFRLRVQQLGYVATTTPIWWVQVGEVLEVVVWVRPDAILLAPLEVTVVHRRFLPVLDGFHRRKALGVGGFFLDREQIDARNASRLTDLLMDVPGVRVENAPDTPGQARMITFSGSLLGPGGGRCPVQVFVDGVLASRRSGGVPLDEIATPNALEGIEVYKGLGSVPAEFLTPESRCGVLALWTRRGGGSP